MNLLVRRLLEFPERLLHLCPSLWNTPVFTCCKNQVGVWILWSAMRVQRSELPCWEKGWAVPRCGCPYDQYPPPPPAVHQIRFLG